MKLSAALLIFLLFAGCGKKYEIPSSLTDDLGNKIENHKPAERIVSLAPNITEGLFAVGAGDKVVGVTTYCNYPDEAYTKTKVGGLVDPNFEIIASLKPDLVIMTVEGNLKGAHETLNKLGIKSFVVNPRNVDGIIKMMNDIGALTGQMEQADSVTRSITAQRDRFLMTAPAKEEILLLISPNPLITANKNSFINEVLELAGFTNIYKDEPLDYPSISYEDVISKNPSKIIIPAEERDPEYAQIIKQELSLKLASTNAVKDKKIYVLDADLLFRPGPRVMDAVRYTRDRVK